MKKGILVVGIVCLMLVLLVCGCTQQEESGTGGGTTGNTVTMTAKEHYDDMSMDTDWSTYITILYDSLEDGDTLIIQDSVTNISYDSNTDATTVTFEWTEGEMTGSLNPVFEGDITGSYQTGDEVKITVTIKHVTFSHEGMSYDMELYEEQWESQDYFISNAGSALGGLKPLPQSCIAKA